MTIKRVMRWDRDAKLLRVCRVMWNGQDTIAGRAYSHKLSLGLTPKLFRWERELGGWFLVVLGVRIHSARSFGGRFV